MIRELFASVAIAGAAISAAPVAAADGLMYPDTGGHSATDVPGMNYEANLTAPCTNLDRFTFGRGPGG